MSESVGLFLWYVAVSRIPDPVQTRIHPGLISQCFHACPPPELRYMDGKHKHEWFWLNFENIEISV